MAADDNSPPRPDGPATAALTENPWGDLAPSRVSTKVTLSWTDTEGAHQATVDATTTIGSAERAPIRVADKTVSRLHLEVQPTEEGLLGIDLDSKNGTWADGTRVWRFCVRDGARIRIGQTDLRVRIEPVQGKAFLWPSAKFGNLLGQSVSMRDLFVRLARAAKKDSTVLIRGESGTGKELIAEAIHENSARADKPFMVFDCAAIQPNLIDAELFGYAKGAFTGATEAKAGAFELADGGTLFIDEIGELPLALQPKLLRVLEKGEVRRLGEANHRRVNVRIVCATHRDLHGMVNDGQFREDLYFRIAVIVVQVPPLRDRPEDIPLLMRRFLPADLQDLVIDPAVIERIVARPWEGNVRELRNFMERALAFGFAEAFGDTPGAPGAVHGHAARQTAPGLRGGIPREFLGGNWFEGKERMLKAWGKAFLEDALERNDRDYRRVAEELGVTSNHVHKMCRDHGVAVKPGPKEG